jgi:hypothetical protein
MMRMFKFLMSKRQSGAGLLLLSLFALLALSVASCTSKPQGTPIGKWQGINSAESIEFLKDGTYHGILIAELQKAPVDISGTYTVQGDLLNLKVTKPEALTPMIWKLEFSDSNNEITVTFQNGGALKIDGSLARFRRVG